MEIELEIKNRIDSNYKVKIWAEYGRVYIKGCQSSGTFVTPHITPEQWPAVKAFIDQQLSQERVVDPEDMVCPQCQKPLTNPDDPCDCPTQDLGDAVTDVLLVHGVASKPLTRDIIGAVKPGYDILRAETATQHRKIGELQADNDTLEKRIERLEKYESYAAYAGVAAKDGDIPVSFVVWMKQFEEALDE